MKNLAISFITCLAFVQSSYAATSSLSESLIEYEAVTSAIGTGTNFQDIISANEFIIDIKRLTKKVNVTGNVQYEILTRLPSTSSDTTTSFESDAIESHTGHNHRNKGLKHIFHTYVATLSVTPNSGIGPNTVTVTSIQKVKRQTNLFSENAQQFE